MEVVFPQADLEINAEHHWVWLQKIQKKKKETTTKIYCNQDYKKERERIMEIEERMKERQFLQQRQKKAEI